MTETRVLDGRFWKMHGAGNDFVVLDVGRDGPPSPELCAFLADRRRGVGCDLVLGVDAPRTSGSVASFRIWTADGEESQQCGNGARCIALWLHRVRGLRSDRFALDSPSDTHEVHVREDGSVRVSFGRADRRAPRTIDVDGATYDYTPVWVGNPHAVVPVDSIDDVPLPALGRRLQDPRQGYDPRVNVGAVERLGPTAFRLRVFEFGAGETLACGSGACAAAVVMMDAELVEETVDVHQRGGTLTIERARDGRLSMTGPATLVHEGRFLSAELPSTASGGTAGGRGTAILTR